MAPRTVSLSSSAFAFVFKQPTVYVLPRIALGTKSKEEWPVPLKPSEEHEHRHLGTFIVVPVLPGSLNFCLSLSHADASLWLHLKAVTPNVDHIDTLSWGHAPGTGLLHVDEISVLTYTRASVTPFDTDISHSFGIIRLITGRAAARWAS